MPVSSLNSFALDSKICEQGRLFYDQPLTEKVKSKVKFFVISLSEIEIELQNGIDEKAEQTGQDTKAAMKAKR